MKIIKLVAKYKYRWALNFDNTSVLIFDEVGSDKVVRALKGIDHGILNIRDVLYLKHLIPSLTKLFKYGIKGVYFEYFVRIIDKINPDLVVTLIDNSNVFWRLDRKYTNKIKFLTIQNGNRWIVNHKNYPNYLSHFFYDADVKKDIYHSNFACISNYDMDLYVKNNINVGKYFSIGSLAIDLHSKNYIKRKKIFDICLVANSINDRLVNLRIMEYLVKYVEEYNISACVALKRSCYSAGFKEYMKIFDQYFGNTTIVVVPHKEGGIPLSMVDSRNQTKRPTLGSQYLSDVSEVTIGFTSTMLRQSFARGNKVYPLNFEINEVSPPFDLFSVNLKPESYEDFSEQLSSMLSINSETYCKNNKELMNYMDVFDINVSPSERLRTVIEGLISPST
jgi:surface carbohydrate biosynthesis protein